MLDWLIVGGGIQGTYLSLYLTRRRRVPMERLRVLDPYAEPLTLWNRFTANSGMEYLRSSHAHNLHFDPFSLVTFARTADGLPLARFIEPYGRPSLELFRAHSTRLIDRYHLADLRVQGRAQRLRRIEGGWRVETDHGGIEARRVILAIGMTEQPFWPGWALDLRGAGGAVDHLFDPAFEREALPPWEQAVVVGGGISAAQAAMALAMRQPGTVTLLMRHAPRVHSFDAEPGWITPAYLDGFHAQRDYGQRRAMIRAARHRGSLPPDVADDLRKAEANRLLVRRQDEVLSARVQGTSSLLELASGASLAVDRVILATGFSGDRPGGGWLDAAIAEYGLPCAEDGFPIVDRSLCWAEGLYVCGPLAELEIGPVARNFAGVKLAAERIGAS
ncbi:MAG: FAD/NAD(P)-binding protein [Anaerolineae bacterium]|nr:FAD/NAD(P)-binding protein [Anaerolineae bacterium]